MYEVGKGLSMADHFEIDDVIDPSDSRRWIIRGLKAARIEKSTKWGNRPMIDTW